MNNMGGDNGARENQNGGSSSTNKGNSHSGNKIPVPPQRLPSNLINPKDSSKESRERSKRDMLLIKKPETRTIRNPSHSLTTRKGRSADVAMNQKFTMFNGRGYKDVKLSDLKKNDYILVPRKVEVPKTIANTLGNPKLKIVEFLQNENPRIVKAEPSPTKIIDELINKYGTRKAVADKLGIHPKTLQEFHKERNYIDYHNYKRLANMNGNQVDVKMIKGERQANPFTLPTHMTPKFAAYWGLLESDGGLKGRSVIDFYNNDPNLRSWYSSLTDEIFGLKTYLTVENTVDTERFNNSMASRFLQWMGMPNEKKSNTVSIPDIIKYGDIKFGKAFLNGYLAGDSGYEGYTLELGTSSIKMKDDLSYLLSRLGITYRVSTRSDGKNHRISVEGKEVSRLAPHLASERDHRKINNLRSYTDEMKSKRHFQSSGAIPLDPNLMKKLPRRVINHDKRATNIYDNVAYSGQRLPKDSLQYFTNVLSKKIKNENLGRSSKISQVNNKFKSILSGFKNDERYLDQVKKIKKIE